MAEKTKPELKAPKWAIYYGLSIIILTFGIIFGSIYNIAQTKHHNKELLKNFAITLDAKWSNEELQALNILVDQSIPEIAQYLGKPPYKITFTIKKGNLQDKNLNSDSYGTKIDGSSKSYNVYFPSPIKSPSICLHELVHLFFQGHQPNNQFFKEGIAIYLQKVIGDKLGYNKDKPNHPEKYYTLGDNFQTADVKELAPYCTKNDYNNSVISNTYPYYYVQYGLYSYLWRTLVQKDRGILKKISAKFYQEEYDYRGIDYQRCLELAEQIMPRFIGWYSSHPALTPNSEEGSRIALLNWPTVNDLTIFYWKTQINFGQTGMLEGKFNIPIVIVQVIKKGGVKYYQTTDIKNGYVVLEDFIAEAKKYCRPPFVVRLNIDGDPNIIKDYEIKSL